jgi:hypothetical protein
MADIKTLHQKLTAIQAELKVPKDEYNNFGGYKFRNLEGIEEKVKPLLKKYELILTFCDDLVEIGGRVYIKATATLTDGQTAFEVSAFAREAVAKKGMDEAQITGSASSYARKYAAAGLFLIDDTKDADSQDNTKHVVSDTPKTQLNSALAGAKKQLNDMFDNYGYDNTMKKTVFINKVLDKKTVDTVDEADQLMAELTTVGEYNAAA